MSAMSEGEGARARTESMRLVSSMAASKEMMRRVNDLLGAELAAELDSFTGELKVNEAVAPYTKHLDLVGAPMSQEQKSMLAAAISGAAGGNDPASPGSVPADVLRRHAPQRGRAGRTTALDPSGRRA